MPKDFSLPNLVKDLGYTVNGTYVHQWLFGVCPPEPGLLMLEPGCGSGKFGLAYALKGAHVTLLDIDPQAVEYCRRLFRALAALVGQGLPAAILRADLFGPVGDLVPEGEYDLVFNEGVPQHWTDEERRQGCIDRMARWAKPGGVVAIVGNNGHNPREQETDRNFQFTYEGMPPTRKCFTREELEERMTRAGLTNIWVTPLGVPDLQNLVQWTGAATLLGAYGRKP